MAKILTVEDDQFTQDFIREVLREDGHQVIVASNANEGSNQLKNNPDIKLVLLDIMLPGRSGWDVFSELRRNHPTLKIIFVSAIEVSDERLASLRRDGLVDYIVKPFTQETLLGAVKKCFELKK